MKDDPGQSKATADNMWGYGYEPEKTLGESLRQLRAARGMSQQDVAEAMTRAGFSWRQTTVAKTEAGSRPVRVNEAAAIALVFGVSVNELLGNQANSPEESVLESRYRVAFSLYFNTRLHVEEAKRRKEAAEREYAESLRLLDELRGEYEHATRAFDEAFGLSAKEGEEQ